MVPQGGNTGLVGAGVPRGGEVLVSLARLADIGPVDAATHQVEAGAGATLAALHEHGCDAAIAAAPVHDTVKHAVDGVVHGTLDRSELWAVQTPQVFRRAALEAALAAGEDVLARATDDASLVEAQGGVVRVVPSPPENFKVTTPHDLRVAELLLRSAPC